MPPTRSCRGQVSPHAPRPARSSRRGRAPLPTSPGRPSYTRGQARQAGCTISFRREERMPEAPNNIIMYGTLWCSDCKRTKQFFGEQRGHYEFVDIERDAAGLAEVERIN